MGTEKAETLWSKGWGFRLRGVRGLLRIAMCAVLAVSACRRPAPEGPWAWEKNPGLDPHPTGQTPQGRTGQPREAVSFQLKPEHRTEHSRGIQAVETEDELYLRAARSGQAWAQAKLGAKYVMQSDDIALMGQGLFWLNAAADQNNTEALRVLAALAMEGRGVDQSEKAAYKYMLRAAELGSPEAQNELANMLSEGRGRPRDMEAALIWGRKAAEQNYAPAQFAVGRVLVGAVEDERRKEGREFLERAAKSGNIGAVVFLSTALARGQFGFEKDEARAESMLKTYAENGNAECQLALATLYAKGDAFAERRGEAKEWLQRAAEGGNPQAIEALRKGASASQR